MKKRYTEKMREDYMKVFGLIQYGAENAIGRAELCRRSGLDDRKVRKAIEELRRDYPVVHTPGKGYFIARIGNHDDQMQALAYFKREQARMKRIAWNARGLQRYLGPIATGEIMAGQEAL